MATGQGVGARLIRKEDDRLMRGRGQFVADLRFAVRAEDLLDVVLTGRDQVAGRLGVLGEVDVRFIHHYHRVLLFVRKDVLNVGARRDAPGTPRRPA